MRFVFYGKKIQRKWICHVRKCWKLLGSTHSPICNKMKKKTKKHWIFWKGLVGQAKNFSVTPSIWTRGKLNCHLHDCFPHSISPMEKLILHFWHYQVKWTNVFMPATVFIEQVMIIKYWYAVPGRVQKQSILDVGFQSMLRDRWIKFALVCFDVRKFWIYFKQEN